MAFIFVLPRACFRLLCLAEFYPVWYLHQILPPTGIIHDKHLYPMAFVSVLQCFGVYGLYCWSVMFGWVPVRLMPSPTLAACRYHPWQTFVSNGIYLSAVGCMACIGVLCLAEFLLVWYLHQILRRREGITFDHFISQIAFILLLDA